MPNSPSAKKRVRQTDSRTLRNKTKRSAMRTAVRNLEEAARDGKTSELPALLQAAYKTIDKCAKLNIVHANAAAHKKSQLARLVNG